MVRELSQYEVCWVDLDPTLGGEMAKRPCVIISPAELNKYMITVVIAPITSTIGEYPFRVNCSVSNKAGQIAVDQLRAVDKGRIGGKIGEISRDEIEKLRVILREMFCE